MALCANELIDLIDTAPSKRLPSGQDCIHGGYVVVSTSLYYISLSLGFGNMMIDIDIQISISERSSGWATNYGITPPSPPPSAPNAYNDNDKEK